MKKHVRSIIICAFIALMAMAGRAFAGGGQYILVIVDNGAARCVQTASMPSIQATSGGGYSATIDGISYSLVYWYDITDNGSIVEYPSTSLAAQLGQVPSWASTWTCGSVIEQTSPSYHTTQYIMSGSATAVMITFDGNPSHHAVVTTY
jgi:hypothetical protein